jgi:hypothetical protein
MAQEDPESEVARLREEQSKTRRNEVYGGLSRAERAEYNRQAERIHVLERTIQARAVAEKSSQSAKAEQRRQWKEESETDTPQAEAHSAAPQPGKRSGGCLQEFDREARKSEE